jgi:hypothetical protein
MKSEPRFIVLPTAAARIDQQIAASLASQYHAQDHAALQRNSRCPTAFCAPTSRERVHSRQKCSSQMQN